MTVRIQSQPFDMGAEVQTFSDAAEGAGAIVTFSGLERDEGGTLSRMEIEPYPGMTGKALEDIRTQAMERWSLADAMIIHRHGPMAPGDQIMMVATAARHRVYAFAAAAVAEKDGNKLRTMAAAVRKLAKDNPGTIVEARGNQIAKGIDGKRTGG